MEPEAINHEDYIAIPVSSQTGETDYSANDQIYARVLPNGELSVSYLQFITNENKEDPNEIDGAFISTDVVSMETYAGIYANDSILATAYVGEEMTFEGRFVGINGGEDAGLRIFPKKVKCYKFGGEPLGERLKDFFGSLFGKWRRKSGGRIGGSSSGSSGGSGGGGWVWPSSWGGNSSGGGSAGSSGSSSSSGGGSGSSSNNSNGNRPPSNFNVQEYNAAVRNVQRLIDENEIKTCFRNLFVFSYYHLKSALHECPKHNYRGNAKDCWFSFVKNLDNTHPVVVNSINRNYTSTYDMTKFDAIGYCDLRDYFPEDVVTHEEVMGMINDACPVEESCYIDVHKFYKDWVGRPMYLDVEIPRELVLGGLEDWEFIEDMLQNWNDACDNDPQDEMPYYNYMKSIFELKVEEPGIRADRADELWNTYSNSAFVALVAETYFDESPSLIDFQNKPPFIERIRWAIKALRETEEQYHVYADVLEEMIECDEFETVGDLAETWYLAKDLISQIHDYQVCEQEQRIAEWMMAIYSPDIVGTIFSFAIFNQDMTSTFRTKFINIVSRRIGGRAWNLSKGFDTFAKFKNAHGTAGPGKHWHHIVEQETARILGRNPKLIHHPKNLARIDGGFTGSLHSKINSLYQTKGVFQDVPRNISLRNWLRTQTNKSWEWHYEWGLKVIREAQKL